MLLRISVSLEAWYCSRIRFIESALESVSRNRPGSIPGERLCVVFVAKTLNSLSTSLYPGEEMGTGECNAEGNPTMDKHLT